MESLYGDHDMLYIVEEVNPKRSKETVSRRLHKLTEEVGEVAEAYLSTTSPTNLKGKTEEDILEESVDCAIMALDIALTYGSRDEVVAMFDEKIAKWEDQMARKVVVTGEESP